MKIIGNNKKEELEITIQRAGLELDNDSTEVISIDTNDLNNGLINEDILISKSELNKVYIWGDARLPESHISKLDQMVNTVLNDNIHYLKTHSIIRLVEDIRLLHESEKAKTQNQELSDILLVYNSFDQSQTKMISQLLAEVLSVKELCYDQNGEFDFLSALENDLPFGKMIVLLFFGEGEWASQFLPELWKINGGGGSSRKILVVSDKDNATIRKDLFNVIFATAPIPMIPLEIKMQFEKK